MTEHFSSCALLLMVYSSPMLNLKKDSLNGSYTFQYTKWILPTSRHSLERKKILRTSKKCAQHNQENWHVCPTFNQTHKRRKRCYPRVAMKASPTHYTCDCLWDTQNELLVQFFCNRPLSGVHEMTADHANSIWLPKLMEINSFQPKIL